MFTSKYYVFGCDFFGEKLPCIEDSSPNDCERVSNEIDDPKKAIEMWFRVSKKYPTETSILAHTRADACDLLKEATPEYLTELHQKYGSCYKLDYLIEGSADNLGRGCSGLLEGEFGDQIFPFCNG